MGNGLKSGGRGDVGDLNPKPLAVKGITNAKTISAGDGHVAVLLRDGTLRLWGHDGWGEIGIGTHGSYHESPKKPALTNVAAVYLGNNKSFAVRLDGTLWRWGWGSHERRRGIYQGPARADSDTAPVASMAKVAPQSGHVSNFCDLKRGVLEPAQCLSAQ